MLSDLENIKESQPEAKYCIEKINIKWLKEFGRIDPEGASLFLDPRISIFWRIFLPFVILLNFVIFISTNTGISSSSFLVFNVGRKIRALSLFDSSLSNTVQNAWEAGAWVMAIVTATFRGFWPYLILMSMLVFFCLPTNILSHKNREKFLIILQS